MKVKKIIHIDMDYFFAQVEERDNPKLINKPVAVGGSYSGRGVLCTSNYVARKFGVKSAMPSFTALKLCPDIIFIKPDFTKYSQVSDEIFRIFYEYTDKVEGISLDEAYLDVTNSEHCFNSATLMAKEIREKIFRRLGLTASAGVSYNKMLAKICSEYNKPNGLFVIPPGMADPFLADQPVSKISGVGKVTNERLKSLGVSTFEDLKRFSKLDLLNLFGQFGSSLYEFARGIDLREVESYSERKSLSVENTFESNLLNVTDINLNLSDTYFEMIERLKSFNHESIKSYFVKIKYADFSKTTIESQLKGELELDDFIGLCMKRLGEISKPIRLLGTGVRFYNDSEDDQLNLPLAL
jgi:DNA polymerase-4